MTTTIHYKIFEIKNDGGLIPIGEPGSVTLENFMGLYDLKVEIKRNAAPLIDSVSIPLMELWHNGKIIVEHRTMDKIKTMGEDGKPNYLELRYYKAA